jgi:hypothetical protein
VGVLILGISGPPLGSPGTKWHLNVDPMAMHKIYYKEKDGGFPQVRAMVSLVSSCARGSSEHQKCSNYALTNLLFDFCKSMWVLISCHSSKSHPRALTCLSTPKVLRVKKRPNSFSFRCLHLWIHNWVHKELGGGCVIYHFLFNLHCCFFVICDLKVVLYWINLFVFVGRTFVLQWVV